MATRILVSDVIKSGSRLYELLMEEPKLKDERWTVTTKNTDFDELENGLKEAIDMMHDKIILTEKELVQTEADAKSLQSTLQKRKMELERSEERLATIMNVRPAYMDEYEILQKDLQGLFSVYVERFRNLQWLESQLEGFHLAEQQKHDEVQRRMKCLQRRLHDEEMKILHGSEMAALSLENDHSSEIGDYGPTTFGSDNYFSISQQGNNFQCFGNAKAETDVMDNVSSGTPSLDQEIDGNDSDNNF